MLLLIDTKVAQNIFSYFWLVSCDLMFCSFMCVCKIWFMVYGHTDAVCLWVCPILFYELTRRGTALYVTWGLPMGLMLEYLKYSSHRCSAIRISWYVSDQLAEVKPQNT